MRLYLDDDAASALLVSLLRKAGQEQLPLVVNPRTREELGDRAMTLTISLDDALAEEPRRRACAQDLSPEQAARALLSDALHRIAQEEAWGR